MPVQTKAQVLSLLQEYQKDLRRFGVSRCSKNTVRSSGVLWLGCAID